MLLLLSLVSRWSVMRSIELLASFYWFGRSLLDWFPVTKISELVTLAPKLFLTWLLSSLF